MKHKKDSGYNKKVSFCESTKCTFVILTFIVAMMAVVVIVTFMSSSVRVPVENRKLTSLKWWQASIIYQIYPRSFQDSNGDGTGDLKGIISRLSYFNYLNVGAIWLSPFYKSPMRDFGYDVSDYREVDPIFGTIEDFKSLIQEAHTKGLKVLIDFVPNHTSNDSAWFIKSKTSQPGDKYRDFYIWNPGKLVNEQREPPNNWESVFGGPAWTWDEDRQAYYYHNYLESQPDLNYRNTEVRNEMDNVLRFWLDKGVDGFRVDAVTYLFEVEDQTLNIENVTSIPQTNGFKPNPRRKYTKNRPEVIGVVKRWRNLLDEYDKRDGNTRVLIAETNGISQETRTEYYNTGSVPFFYELISAKKRCGATPQCFLKLIKRGLDLASGQWPNFVIGNHDSNRIASRLGHEYVNAMNMMLLTLPGTPTTYYGEELGMRDGNYSGMTPKDPKAITSHNLALSRDPERNPMQWEQSPNAGFTTGEPWLPITPNTDFLNINVEVEKLTPYSCLYVYKKLAELRHHEAFQSTAIELPETANDILVYIRGNIDKDNDRYAVAINLGRNKARIKIQTGATRGIIEASTFPTATREITLDAITLNVGEGLVIRLLR